jgi:NAD(P)-dependent dehydrogenase (short-subunit alcohol dehydrogenase family)
LLADFGDKKITVNAVAPGGIKTDMYHAVCREYIPNGANLTDDEVDEVSFSLLSHVVHTTTLGTINCRY